MYLFNLISSAEGFSKKRFAVVVFGSRLFVFRPVHNLQLAISTCLLSVDLCINKETAKNDVDARTKIKINININLIQMELKIKNLCNRAYNTSFYLSRSHPSFYAVLSNVFVFHFPLAYVLFNNVLTHF